MAKAPSALTDLLLTLPSSAFKRIAKLRGSMYDSGVLTSHAVPVPVVSIGNITAGGTGKTPITSWLTNELKQRGLACGIVSRGYGGTEKGPKRVPADGLDETALRFGDEPSWLAATHPETPVVIGGDRVRDVEELLKHSSVQMVLADDAFQHRRLKRDLDLVVIDATEPRWHYRPLPLGRMREGFESLARAKFVFLSKTNRASEEQLSWIRGNLRDLQIRYKFKVIEFESVLAGFVPLKENRADAAVVANPFAERRDGSTAKKSRFVVMTAIGRPAVFSDMVIEQTGGEVAEAFEFRDHHVFTEEDRKRVQSRAVQLKARAILVTEKDATKLHGWEPKVACYVSRLIARPVLESSHWEATALQELYETIGRLVR
ncbi:MAG: tetraacyldisaccharide 4'-kinase [Proteobacteria bacterium]|nr:MAG: tetraacyldisaccharide 4'-kinase [Pseudomonadota bacterium]